MTTIRANDSIGPMNRALFLFLFLAVMLIIPKPIHAQSIPLGFTINANGSVGQLTLSIDNQRNVTGTVYGNPIFGFWDEASQKITFVRVIDPNNLSTLQIYTGFLFQGGENINQGGNIAYYLTGYFEAFQGTGAVAGRVLYGWYARVSLIS